MTLYPLLLPSLKLTAKAPENGWLEDDRFLLGFGLFSGAKMLVLGRVMVQKSPKPTTWDGAVRQTVKSGIFPIPTSTGEVSPDFRDPSTV